jgi:hypothetical protein
MNTEDCWNVADRIRVERENPPSATWPTVHPTWNTMLRPVFASDSSVNTCYNCCTIPG